MIKSFKPYQSILLIGAILGCLWLMFAPSKEELMQLVNVKTGFIVVEYKKDKTIFHDRFLEQEMKQRGIIIPPHLQKDFGNKPVVRLNDKEFQKAFKEIYYQLSLNHQTYHWKE
jgi:hypothetical protein